MTSTTGPRRLLAIGHDGSRTGAPTTLLETLRWAHRERGVEVTTVLLADGPLAPAFGELGPVRLPPSALARGVRVAAALDRPGWAAPARRAWVRGAVADAGDVDLVLASSAASRPALEALPDDAAPLVVHLHELDGVLDALGGAAALAPALARAALVVVPSPEVAALASRPVAEGGLGVPEALVRRHPGPVGAPPRHRPPGRDDVALVAGCGTVGWRKGTDLFVALADAVGPEVDGRTVHWAWIGGDSADGTLADVADEIVLRGLGDRVHMSGEVADVAPRLAAADVLAITSREDPYPLVAVEAAMVGTPVVGFRPGTTLLGEAGQDDRRVDHLDLDALAAQVRALLAAPEEARAVSTAQARAAAAAAAPLALPPLWDDLASVARERAS